MTLNGQYKISIERRLSTLEANYSELSDKISEITDNHLVHLSTRIEKIEKTATGILITLIFNLLGLIFILLKGLIK